MMIQLKENTRTEGRTEGLTLFHRTLPATATGSQSYMKGFRYALTFMYE